MTRLTDQAAGRTSGANGCRLHLPAEIHARVSGVNEREGTLVVFAESAAWCARLRFALMELEGSLRAAHPLVQSIEVRVLPRS